MLSHNERAALEECTTELYLQKYSKVVKVSSPILRNEQGNFSPRKLCETILNHRLFRALGAKVKDGDIQKDLSNIS